MLLSKAQQMLREASEWSSMAKSDGRCCWWRVQVMGWGLLRLSQGPFVKVRPPFFAWCEPQANSIWSECMDIRIRLSDQTEIAFSRNPHFRRGKTSCSTFSRSFRSENFSDFSFAFQSHSKKYGDYCRNRVYVHYIVQYEILCRMRLFRAFHVYLLLSKFSRKKDHSLWATRYYLSWPWSGYGHPTLGHVPSYSVYYFLCIC